MQDQNDYILLTPGPLTTSRETRAAMMRDWGSWDTEFRELTKKVTQQLLQVLDADSPFACIPLQGSGTFSVEAALGTLVPRTGCVLVPNNGAYCQRILTICEYLEIHTIEMAYADDEPFSVAEIEKYLQDYPQITHLALVHCETSAGLVNPVGAVVDLAERYRKAVIIDAMSSFGALPIPTRSPALHAVVAASGKCLEGVPGMGFVFVRQEILPLTKHLARSLSLDLYDQWHYMQRTGQWRFTPPTHVVAALSVALDQYFAEGGRLARLEKYSTHAAILVEQMQANGLQPFLPAEIRSPIIVTFLAPEHPQYDFTRFYEKVRARGYILYPGKLTECETFRVGCIGSFSEKTIQQAVQAIADSLEELGVLQPVSV